VTLPPAVVVHGLADARLALEAALQASRPVTLLSAPGAAGYAGCGWWRAMVEAARMGVPDAEATDVLDCLDQTGRAIEALRLGLRRLVLLPTAPAREDAAERAAVLGAVLFASRPPALDLAAPGAARHLATWLASER